MKKLNIFDNFLNHSEQDRKDILCNYIKSLPTDKFDELCFLLTAPENLYKAWYEEIPMTKEFLKQINRIFFMMQSGSLTFQLAKRYGSSYNFNNIICELTPDELKAFTEATKRLNDNDIINFIINENL